MYGENVIGGVIVIVECGSSWVRIRIRSNQRLRLVFVVFNYYVSPSLMRGLVCPFTDDGTIMSLIH
jgi:hypothetical protein